jgi:hypothetical protein
MQSKATSVQQYLESLPADRRTAIEAVRKVILANLDKDYEEGMTYGMIGYYVPHRIYPAGYHCDPKQPLPYVNLASQKNHMAVYMMSIYMDKDLSKWFVDEWAKTGKKLEAGKSCIRFKKLEDLALDVIGKAIKRTPAKKHVAYMEAAVATRSPAPQRATKQPRAQAASKKSK